MTCDANIYQQDGEHQGIGRAVKGFKVRVWGMADLQPSCSRSLSRSDGFKFCHPGELLVLLSEVD